MWEVLPLALTLGKAAYGGIQALTAKRPKAPGYQIPSEAYEALSIQRGIASQTDYYQRQKEELEAESAGTVGALKEAATGTDLLSAITDTYRNQALVKRQYDQASLDRKIMEQKSLQDALGVMANYQEKAWELNRNIPFKRKMNEFIDQRKAAGWNIYTGLSEAAGYGFNMWAGQQGAGADGRGTQTPDYMLPDQFADMGGTPQYQWEGAPGAPGVGNIPAGPGSVPGMDMGVGVGAGAGVGMGFGAPVTPGARVGATGGRPAYLDMGIGGGAFDSLPMGPYG